MLKGRKILKKREEVKLEAPTISAEEVIKSTASPKEFKSSKTPATIYAIIVLLLGLYVIKDQFYTDKSKYNDYPDPVVVESKISKIDTTKDYIYFENKKVIASITEGNMYEKDIVININNNSLTSIASTLNDKKNSFKDDYVYTSNNNGVTSSYNSTNKFLNEFKYLDYDVYKSNNFISLIVYEHSVILSENKIATDITSYNISMKTGKIYSDEDLLTYYHVDREDIEKNINGTNTSYFVNNDCIGVMYNTSENTLGYSSYLSHNCLKKAD